MCLGTRERLPRDEMIRLVCAPDGRVLVDRYLKAPGRGAHLCYTRVAIEQAVRRRAFAKAFKGPVGPVEVEPLIAAVIEAIDARVDDLLSLGRRSGRVISGADVVERAGARLRLIILATDTAPGTVERFRGRAAAIGCPCRSFADREHLGTTQGKVERAILGVTDEALARRLLRELDWRAAVAGGDSPPEGSGEAPAAGVAPESTVV